MLDVAARDRPGTASAVVAGFHQHDAPVIRDRIERFERRQYRQPPPGAHAAAVARPRALRHDRRR
jgi:hypothetical protein